MKTAFITRDVMLVEKIFPPQIPQLLLPLKYKMINKRPLKIAHIVEMKTAFITRVVMLVEKIFLPQIPQLLPLIIVIITITAIATIIIIIKSQILKFNIIINLITFIVKTVAALIQKIG